MTVGERNSIPLARTHRIDADGVNVFYREAGSPDAPVVLLLHGFPTSSFQYRELIPRLADQYRVIAPDLPGFGFTEVSAQRNYTYTFDSLAKTVEAFTEALHLFRYAMYVFDYGAPTGFRLAMAHPERVTAIISQNGNAYGRPGRRVGSDSALLEPAHAGKPQCHPAGVNGRRHEARVRRRHRQP